MEFRNILRFPEENLSLQERLQACRKDLHLFLAAFESFRAICDRKPKGFSYELLSFSKSFGKLTRKT